MRTLPFLLSLGFLASCTSHGEQNPAEPAVLARHAPAAVLSSVKAHPPFRSAFDVRTVIEPRADGFRVARSRPATFRLVGAKPIQATLPATGDGPLRIALADDPAVSFEVHALLAPATRGEIVDGAVVHAGSGDADDLVFAPDEDRVEELRVIRRKGASITLRWSIALGSALAKVTVRDGGFSLDDASGKSRFATGRLFAIDARGTHRSLAPRLEQSGKVLVAELDARGLVRPIVIDPVWAATAAAMSAVRSSHASVALTGGDVLVVGSGTSSTAEVFNPATNTFAATSALIVPARIRPGAERLLSGDVLIAGGQTGSTTATAELFSASAKTWSSANAMPKPKELPILLRLTSGNVVAVGDNTGADPLGVALYTASSKTWSAITPLPSIYGALLGERLGDGRVVVLDIASALVFDEGTSTFKVGSTKPFECAVDLAAHAPTGSSSVLIFGGRTPSEEYPGSTCKYDATTNTWTVLAPAPAKFTFATATALADGRILVAGGSDLAGQSLSSAWVYDPARDSWSSAGKLTSPRARHGASLTTAGRVLLTGGVTDAYLYDELSSAEIFTPLAKGVACASSGECASGNCVDGVCCESACGGACQACNVGGALGTCSPLTGAPHSGRSCGAYGKCAAGACLATCSADADCGAGNYCVSSSCTTKKDTGSKCDAARECASGLCVDGTCCNAACGGQCEACDVPGKEGVCWPVAGKPHGTRATCTGPTDATCGARCDGADRTKCNIAPASTTCSADGCTAGVERHASVCTGSGTCADVVKSCGAYACGATACKTSCTATSDCAAGFGCKSGSCQPLDGLGKSCADSGSCASGTFCTDGICCGVAACPASAKCIATSTGATCKRVDGTACEADDQCASSHCVDGVCCDTGCAGQCQACDALGNVGKCTTISGAPHGTRTACAGDAASPCSARRCDGADPTTCAAVAPTTLTCKPASCAAGIATLAATCDGEGACQAPATAPCGAYACDPTTSACRTTCATSGDCATGNVCSKGACVTRAGTCSSDGLSLVDVKGTASSCAPFVCRDDACLTSCTTTSDCATGTVCNVGTGLCEAIPDPGTSPEDSGCTTSRAGSSTPLPLLWFGLAMVIAWRRRWALPLALLGCSPQKTARPEVETTTAVELVARSSFGARLAAADPLRPSAGGFASESRRGLDVVLPDDATRPVHLANQGASLDLRDARLSAVPARMDDKSSTHVGALTDTDVVRIVDARGFEELRVLRSANAPATIDYEPKLSPGLRIVVREGRVEVRDAHDHVAFATEPAFAVDAVGTRRQLTVEASSELLRFRLDTHDLVYPIVVDPAWTTAADSLLEAHAGGVFARLASGKILAAGGMTTLGVYGSTAEIWDPATKTSTTAGAISGKRAGLYGGRLPDGKVLVAGGLDESYTAVTVSQLYDPATGVWSMTSPMVAPAPYNGCVSLSTGHVLVPSSDSLSTYWSDRPQVFDPGTKTWKKTGPTAVLRNQCAIAPLAGGKALAVGNGSSIAEVYDVTTNTWTAVAPLSAPSGYDTAVTLADGSVMVAGGGSTKVEIYHPTTNTWSSVASFAIRRFGPMLTLLPSGRVLASGGRIGGSPVADALVWDPTRNVWLDAPPMARRRVGHPAIVLASGEVWTTTVSVGPETRDVELFKPLANGSTCTLAGECASGFCTEGACCNVAACGAGESCAIAGSAGSCRKKLGETCTSGAVCGSGQCVDGVCCDSACSGQCEACDVLGSVGKCVAVTGGTRGTRPACASDPTDACKNKRCDGTDRSKCNYAPSGTVACGVASCAAGIETHASTCNGAGACGDLPKTCGAYGCGTTACKSSCTTKDDCAAGSYCGAGACVPLVGLGKTCAGSDACGTGLFCTDGVCCASASCGADATCAASGKLGICTKKAGAKCGLDAECATGHCADGVCCDSACTGQCEACDVMGSVGACLAVKGAPRGARPACDAPSGELCKARSCDALERTTCAAFAATTVTCRVATCSAGGAISASTCDGAGNCPAPTTTSCAGFVCDATTSSCKTTCAGNADCRDGYECTGGACRASTARCSDDATTVLLPGGAFERCYPGICRAGVCTTKCGSTADCAPRFVCETSSGTCVLGSATTEEEPGGCGFGGGGSATGGALVLALLALGRARRGVSRPPRGG